MAGTFRDNRDTGRRRWADSARPYRAALARFAGHGRPWMYTVPLHLPEWVTLHSETASAAARLATEALCGSHPARWKLEKGRCGSLHAHVITPLPPAALVGHSHGQPVHDLRGALAYLGKPANAALCRRKLRPWSPDERTRRRAVFLALDEAGDARRSRLERGKRRLPPVTGWTGRRTSPAQTHMPALALRLSLLLAWLTLALSLAVSALLAALPTWHTGPARRAPSRPVQRRTRPRPPDRSLSGLRL